MKTAIINLYNLSELEENAKQLAIYEHIDFLDNEGIEEENENGEMVTDYSYKHTKSDAIDSINMNEYLFYSDGELANCVTYTGTHPKAGITELKFKNQIIQL